MVKHLILLNNFHKCSIETSQSSNDASAAQSELAAIENE